jgi:signal transduction histidine kinase
MATSKGWSQARRKVVAFSKEPHLCEAVTMSGRRLLFERATRETIRARVAGSVIIAAMVIAFGPYGRGFAYVIGFEGGVFPSANDYTEAALRLGPLIASCVWLFATRTTTHARVVTQARLIGASMLAVGFFGAEYAERTPLQSLQAVYNGPLFWWIVFIGGATILIVGAGASERMRPLVAMSLAFVPLAGASALLHADLIDPDRLGPSPVSFWPLQPIAVTSFFVVANFVSILAISLAFRGASTRGASLEQDRLAGWLHSELLGDLAALRRRFSAEAPNQEAMLSALADLDSRVREHRLESRLHSERSVPLAEVVAFQMRRFRDFVSYSSVPMLGSIQVEPGTAQNVDRVLGDLVANAVAAGANTIGIEIALNKRSVVIEVIDDGPGIAADRARSGGGLQLLEQSLHEDGGSLAINAGSNGQGTRVTVTVPTNR